MTSPITTPVDDHPATQPGASGRSRIARRIEAISSSGWFAYPTILVLQLRTVWGFWDGRDLSFGDTSGYFTVARSWAESFTNVFFWSPAYTAYYGTVLKLTGDPVAATLVHRLILAFLVTTLVLALARRLLPPSAAWIVAAWWAILPVNFDALYEVHLFGALPALAAALVAGRWPGHGGRAAVLAIFGASALLVRNEYVFAALLFAVVSMWALVVEMRRSTGFRLGRAVKPYVIAGALALAAIGFFYLRSSVKLPLLGDLFDQRRTLNFCQAYAFNYAQRNPEWEGMPFTECSGVVQEVFDLEPGMPGTSLGFADAWRRNPGAVGDYLLWNIGLVPSGLQLALFNQISGSVSPDYIEVAGNRTMPWLLSIACLLVLLAGGWSILQKPDLRARWVNERRWPLLVLASCCAGVVLVMVQQRPRPSYMFPLTFTVMAAVALSGWAIARRTTRARLLPLVVPVAFVLLLVLAPAPYVGRQTPLKDAFRRLAPHSESLGSRATAVPAFGVDLCRYLILRSCRMTDYWTTLRPAALASSLRAAVDAAGVEAVYADEGMVADPVASDFLANPGPDWERLAAADGRWVLLVRDRPADDGS